MNILHFIYDHINNPWVGGGGATRVYEIYKRLGERHSVKVICGKYPGAKDYREGNTEFCFIGTPQNNYVSSTLLYAAKAMNSLHRYAENADIVIEDFAPYNPLFSKFFVNKPLVLQVHHKEGMHLFNRYLLLGVPFMFIESFYPKLFRNVICVSQESKKKFGLKNAVVIPNGIHKKLFEVTPSDGDYIAYMGRLQIHNKGLDTLIEAMDTINSELEIAGRGKDELPLKALAERSGAAKRIRMVGYLSDEAKVSFLACSRLVVVPSRYEGQGIVVLEAAACGKPVIVSDIPELRYAVNAGFGISFRMGKASDLSEKMRFLLNNASLRKEMGEKARLYARDFIWDHVAEEYEKFIISTVGSTS
jgi:glycogen(starch) synthase